MPNLLLFFPVSIMTRGDIPRHYYCTVWAAGAGTNVRPPAATATANQCRPKCQAGGRVDVRATQHLVLVSDPESQASCASPSSPLCTQAKAEPDISFVPSFLQHAACISSSQQQRPRLSRFFSLFRIAPADAGIPFLPIDPKPTSRITTHKWRRHLDG